MKIKSLLFLLGACLSCGAATQIPGDIDVVEVFPPGSFTMPLALRHAGDGSDRIFIVQQNGVIRVVVDGDLLGTPFLDISALTSAGTFSEQGLLGLAFHPQFASNGLLYINHTASGVSGVTNGDTVVAEYQVSGDPNVVDTMTRRHIIVIPQDFGNHNGGDIHFGPDGYLYIGMGDGGSGGDPCNRAQTLDPTTTPGGSCRSGSAAWLLGKMLRIDVDDTMPAGSNNLCAAAGDGSAEYAVPGDNPYVGDSDRCGEVWSYGLRNPYRFSFDRDTGDMWIGDVGQGTWEEVDFEPATATGGLNYGWRVCEGSFIAGSTTTSCNLTGAIDPVLEYRTSLSGHCAITGGYRYRGPVASAQGMYIYADFCSRRVWVASETSPGTWAAEEFGIVGTGSGYPDGLSGFGEDEAGHLYMMQRNGRTWRLDGDIAGPPELELVFTTQPANADEGETLAPVVVEIQDDGDTQDGDNDTVITLTIESGPGALSGTTSLTVIAGVATFADLSIDQAGSYTLRATSDHDPVLTVVSGTFEILEPGSKDDPVFDDRFEEQAP